MPRIARLVIPGVPHHVIQRGNRRQSVFFSDEDKSLYIRILKSQGKEKGIRFWAYCLMGNHVHFIAVPKFSDSLSRGIGEAHRRYTNLINIREDWKGYLWQGRFLSFPLDDTHLFATARYIERNPVRARLVLKAEDFKWSSARAHVFRARDELLSGNDPFLSFDNWHKFLVKDEPDEEVSLIRKHTSTGRPLGSEEFIRKLETITGRTLLIQKPGRKPAK